MYYYCIYCEANRCEMLSATIERIIGCRVIYPVRIQHIWSKGSMIDIEKPLIPGYLFLYSDNRLNDLKRLESITGVYKLLRYSDNKAELKDSDRDFAIMMLEYNGIIGKMPVFKVGDKIILDKGILKGIDAKIIKVNKRNCRMQVEMTLAGSSTKMWLDYFEK